MFCLDVISIIMLIGLFMLGFILKLNFFLLFKYLLIVVIFCWYLVEVNEGFKSLIVFFVFIFELNL